MKHFDRNQIYVVKVENITLFILTAVTVLSSSAIAHGDTTLYDAGGTEKSIYVLITRILPIIASVLMLLTKMYRFDSLVIVPIVYTIITVMDLTPGIEFTQNDYIRELLNGFRLILICLMAENKISKLFAWYRNVLIVMCAIGIICYIIYLVRLPLFYRIVPYYTLNGLSEYIDFRFAFIYRNYNSNYIRLCGLFNEPGYLGTITALVLCADKYDLKKKGNVIMLIAGCLSFSLAFFIITLIYSIIVSYKKRVLFIALLSLFLFYIVLIPILAQGEGAIAAIASRLVISSDGLSGDNRTTELFNSRFSLFIASDNWFWGYGGQAMAYFNIDNVLSYKAEIFKYGVMGFILIYIPIIIYSFKKTKLNFRCITFIICFFASVYQRPNIYNMVYFVILFGGIQNLLSNETKDVNTMLLGTKKEYKNDYKTSIVYSDLGNKS